MSTPAAFVADAAKTTLATSEAAADASAAAVSAQRLAPPTDAVVAQPGAEPSAPAEVPPALDAERLVVYSVALQLQALSASLVPPTHRVLQDQLERASLSVVLNIAEGAGRHSRKDKRRFYAIARGSACECAAAVDVVRKRRLSPESACGAARLLALRVVQMLTKLDKALA